MPTAQLQPVATVGIDIGKNSFHLICLDERGAIILRQKLSRGQVEARLANMPACLIGMEACVGAHHLSRQLLALGHDVKLIPAQFVAPFRKSHKNDFRDAEAIAEAVQRPTMRFGPTQTVEQLDLQALHRVRSRLVSQRTAVVNQIRAFLLERGVAVRQGLRSLRQVLPDILARRTDVLTPRMTHMIEGLMQDWHHLDERIDAVTEEIGALVAADEACQRLMSVPGVGPIIASAMVATIGNGAAFHRGRDFGAWLGLVPRQISTGDRTVLGRLSKRGNSYLRSLLVQAARVLLLWPAKWRQHSFGNWLMAASARLHHNVLAAALANKLARIAWSVLSQNRTYEPRMAAAVG
jgi:transposase